LAQGHQPSAGTRLRIQAGYLETLFESQNRSGRKEFTSIPATFLLVSVAVG